MYLLILRDGTTEMIADMPVELLPNRIGALVVDFEVCDPKIPNPTSRSATYERDEVRPSI